MSTSCPICYSSSSLWRAVGQLPIYRCERCSHHFYPIADEQSHVANIYDDSYFVGSDQGYQDYVAEELIQRRSARYYAKLLHRYHPEAGLGSDNRLALDIGAACGFFCSEFQSAGWNCRAIEPNHRMREIAAERFKVSMFDSLESWVASQDYRESNQNTLQLVSMIQVISHLPNPRATLKSVSNLLDKNGLLLIETWDRSSLVARLSGQGWHEWNPPSVIHWFTRTTLKNLVEEEGFEVISQGLPRKQIQVGRAFHMLRHSWRGSALAKVLTAPLALIPQRLALPYVLGDAFWILARKL